MKSIWQNTTSLPHFEPLKKDIRTDVPIIGGGIAGILTAYFLHQSGVKYILVEKCRICSGTTQNTTAKITFQHGLNYHKILKSNGLEAAQKYLLANRKTSLSKKSSESRAFCCIYGIIDNDMGEYVADIYLTDYS